MWIARVSLAALLTNVVACSFSVAGGVDFGAPEDAAALPPADAGEGADLTPPAPPDLAVDPAIEEMHTRADRALSTLMLNWWPTLRANTTTYDWAYAHYWDAVLDAAERRGKNAFAGTARMFYELQDKRGWLDDYYDDENWITLALLHAYDVTGEAIYLDKAKFVFADIMKGWDETCCGAHKGGIFWHKPNDSKVTAINAGAVISAARLYQRTQEKTYLDFANKTFDYWSTYMFDASTGHVYDGVSTAGVVNTTWAFTYNEGLFIGAVLAIRAVRNDPSVLPMAHKAAAYMMQKEMETTALGTILSDGKCGGDGQMFKGVGARYLGALWAADPSHIEYRDFLARSGTAAWTLARDPASGNISCDWQGPYDPATGNEHSLGSAAVGLAAAAKALGTAVPRPAGEYEAEEGNLHDVGLEAKYGAYSGWGYVAGWGFDGQSVDILVDVAVGGDYEVELRYATGDDATRAISVGAQEIAANLAFPKTGGYDTYASVSLTAPLAAGRNTVKIAFVTAKGSRSFINLDRLRLKKK